MPGIAVPPFAAFQAGPGVEADPPEALPRSAPPSSAAVALGSSPRTPLRSASPSAVSGAGEHRSKSPAECLASAALSQKRYLARKIIRFHSLIHGGGVGAWIYRILRKIRHLVVHPLKECDIWRRGDAEAARGAVAPAASSARRRKSLASRSRAASTAAIADALGLGLGLGSAMHVSSTSSVGAALDYSGHNSPGRRQT